MDVIETSKGNNKTAFSQAKLCCFRVKYLVGEHCERVGNRVEMLAKSNLVVAQHNPPAYLILFKFIKTFSKPGVSSALSSIFIGKMTSRLDKNHSHVMGLASLTFVLALPFFIMLLLKLENLPIELSLEYSILASVLISLFLSIAVGLLTSKIKTWCSPERQKQYKVKDEEGLNAIVRSLARANKLKVDEVKSLSVRKSISTPLLFNIFGWASFICFSAEMYIVFFIDMIFYPIVLCKSEISQAESEAEINRVALVSKAAVVILFEVVEAILHPCYEGLNYFLLYESSQKNSSVSNSQVAPKKDISAVKASELKDSEPPTDALSRAAHQVVEGGGLTIITQGVVIDDATAVNRVAATNEVAIVNGFDSDNDGIIVNELDDDNSENDESENGTEISISDLLRDDDAFNNEVETDEDDEADDSDEMPEPLSDFQRFKKAKAEFCYSRVSNAFNLSVDVNWFTLWDKHSNRGLQAKKSNSEPRAHRASSVPPVKSLEVPELPLQMHTN